MKDSLMKNEEKKKAIPEIRDLHRERALLRVKSKNNHSEHNSPIHERINL